MKVIKTLHLIVIAVSLFGCAGERIGKVWTDAGGSGSATPDELAAASDPNLIVPGNGTTGVRTFSSYFKVIKRATVINPPAAALTELNGAYSRAKDQLPQDNLALNMNPGTVFSMITLSGYVADNFIREDLGRAVANRLVLGAVPSSATAVNAGNVLSDDIIRGVVQNAARLFFRRDAWPEELQAGIDARNQIFQKIGNPTAADNRGALLVIITAMLSSLDMIKI